jgi:hypothetical protein
MIPPGKGAIMPRLSILLMLLPLSACQTSAILDEDSPLRPPPPGSRLILNQSISIPAHSAHVVLQGGRVVSGKDINRYHPNCRLEVQKVRDTSQVLQPDEFVVLRSRQESRTAGLEQRLHVAGPFHGGAGGPSFVMYQTIFELQSVKQPQVRWMTCEQWGDPAIGQHLTPREIRNALGDVMRLELPAATPP